MWYRSEWGICQVNPWNAICIVKTFTEVNHGDTEVKGRGFSV